MKRRTFIRTVAPATLLPFFMNGFSFKVFADSPLIQALGKNSNVNDHILVLVQLNGGNDGLNTLIPLDQYSNLSKARSNILISESKVLKLTGTDITGFHPAMTGMRSLYDEGKITAIQDVGYPNPNFSHFRSTDIWLTGSDSNEVLTSGWGGRYLDYAYPGFPDDYPNVDMPDPLAIQIGSIVSPALQGPEINMGMAITSSSDFYQLITGNYDPEPNTPYGHELSFIRLVAGQTQKYTNAIKTAAGKTKNLSSLYPASGTNVLADQLKIVAQLIAGGLKTKIYVVNLGGFDTHADQVNTNGTDSGQHANLLKTLSEAITAFQDDIQLMKIQDKVLGMTFSEFGRRIKSNGSMGTDHGAAAPLFFFGSQVKGGIIGHNPDIPDNVSVNDNVPMQIDFRSIYATVIRDWFGVPDEELKDIMLHDFDSLPVVNTSINDSRLHTLNSLDTNYPNPYREQTTIGFTSTGGHVLLQVFDSQGRVISTLVNEKLSAGKHYVEFNEPGLASGTYYYRLQLKQGSQVKSMVKL